MNFQQIIEVVGEFFNSYASHLNETITTVPLWVLMVTILLLQGLMNLGKSIKMAVKTLKWLNDKADKLFDWLIKKLDKWFPKKPVAPKGYRFTGRYIIANDGSKLPELEKI